MQGFAKFWPQSICALPPERSCFHYPGDRAVLAGLSPRPVAVVAAELIAHLLRFITFRRFVFPAKRGYQVSLARYVVSALPVSVAGVLAVAFLRNRLDRSMLTLSIAAVALGVGFLRSRFVYSQPVAKR